MTASAKSRSTDGKVYAPNLAFGAAIPWTYLGQLAKTADPRSDPRSDERLSRTETVRCVEEPFCDRDLPIRASGRLDDRTVPACIRPAGRPDSGDDRTSGFRQ